MTLRDILVKKLGKSDKEF